MRAELRRENRLGLRGWLWAGRYGLERYLYVLHRLTGLGILLYGMIHLIVMTVFRLQGESFYDAVMRVFSNPGFKVGEYLVFAAFIYHALNGARLTLQELGFFLGKPRPQVYPYRDALRQKRALVLGMIGLVVVLAVLALLVFVGSL